jgi:hypothetical protein
MFLIGHQIRGQVGCRLHGGPYETETPEASLEAVPIPRIAAKDLGNGPPGHMKPHEKHRVGHLCDPATHIGQDKRGSERIDLVRLLNPYPPTSELLFARRRSKAIEGIPPAKCWGEQLGRERLQVLQALSRIGILGKKALILGLGER